MTSIIPIKNLIKTKARQFRSKLDISTQEPVFYLPSYTWNSLRTQYDQSVCANLP